MLFSHADLLRIWQQMRVWKPRIPAVLVSHVWFGFLPHAASDLSLSSRVALTEGPYRPAAIIPIRQLRGWFFNRYAGCLHTPLTLRIMPLAGFYISCYLNTDLKVMGTALHPKKSKYRNGWETLTCNQQNILSCNSKGR